MKRSKRFKRKVSRHELFFLYPLCLLHLLISQFRSTDPFLYYSITGARGAISLKEVDFLSKTTKSAHNVLRKTRVSVETHTDLLLDDDLLKNGLDLDLGELDDLLDDLLLKLK